MTPTEKSEQVSAAPQSGVDEGTELTHRTDEAAVADTIWHLLVQATSQRTAFTTMQLATLNERRSPSLRTVIIRRVNEATRSLVFITDTASAKVREIRQHPAVALTGYDAEGMQQLRLEGVASIVSNEKRRNEFWRTLAPHTHVLYRSHLVPGTPIAHPDDAFVTRAEAPLDSPAEQSENSEVPLDSTEAPPRFALVDVRIERVDWLQLGTSPHRRFQLHSSAEGVTGTWVVP